MESRAPESYRSSRCLRWLRMTVAALWPIYLVSKQCHKWKHRDTMGLRFVHIYISTVNGVYPTWNWGHHLVGITILAMSTEMPMQKLSLLLMDLFYSTGYGYGPTIWSKYVFEYQPIEIWSWSPWAKPNRLGVPSKRFQHLSARRQRGKHCNHPSLAGHVHRWKGGPLGCSNHVLLGNNNIPKRMIV